MHGDRVQMSVNNMSKRLAAIGALVTEGGILADIGTDHALLPIRLVLDGKVPRAIAMDVNEGPLARAGEAIRRAGLADRIQTRLSDGFAALKEGEADSAVIAGMGGDLVIRILTECREADRFQLERDMNRELRLIFERHGINIPFPQIVVNRRKEES